MAERRVAARGGGTTGSRKATGYRLQAAGRGVVPVACSLKPVASRRYILVINPGSTSTKLALFRVARGGEPRLLDESDLGHPAQELNRFRRVADQESFRAGLVERYLGDAGVAPHGLAAAVGRGGLLRPLTGGTYAVSPRMLRELRAARWGEHASNLGALLAARVARRAGCPAFIVDPVVTDELAPEARLTGLPQIGRRSVFHALNQRAAARQVCRRLGLRYDQSYLVVAHLGGGVSVGAHRRGRIVEVTNALDGEGPFSPERAGGLPAAPLVRLALSGQFTPREISRMIAGRGGLVAHLGTNSLIEVERRIARGDRRARLVFDAMAYGLSRAIAAAAAALGRRPKRIVLTGAMARSKLLVAAIRRRAGFLAPIAVIPGSLEMPALAHGAWRAMTGRERAKRY